MYFLQLSVLLFFFQIIFISIFSARLDENTGHIRLLPRLLRGQIVMSVLSQLERIALRSQTAWDYDGHQQHTRGHGVTFRHQGWKKAQKSSSMQFSFGGKIPHWMWNTYVSIADVKWWRGDHAEVSYHIPSYVVIFEGKPSTSF